MRSFIALCVLLSLTSAPAGADDEDERYETNRGFVDRHGVVRVKRYYIYLRSGFTDGFLCVQEGDGSHWFFLDVNGKRLGKLKLANCRNFSEGLASVDTFKKGVVFLDDKGKIAIAPRWKKQRAEQARDFHDGLAPVRIGAKWGYIDKTGKWVIQPKYGPDMNFKAWERKLEKLDRAGEEDAYAELYDSVDFDAARDFSEGRAAVRVGDKWGYIDTTGAMVIPPTWSALAFESAFSEGLAVVEVSEGYSYIDGSGKVVLPGPFAKAGRMSEGLAAVKDVDGWRYIDKTGKTVITLGAIDGWANDFHEGAAAVKDGKFGYIDKTGKWIIKPSLDYGADFHGGLVSVQKESVAALIDLTGHVVWTASDPKGVWKDH